MTTFLPNPNNLLLVDEEFRQPDLIGWYADGEDGLKPENWLLPGNGLLPGGITVGTLRYGNGNDTITLVSNQSIYSHLADEFGNYPESFPVTPGSPYDLACTALGIAGPQTRSTSALKVIWVDSSGSVISEVAQGIISAFGQNVRNSVFGVAPVNAAGAIVSFSTDNAVVITFPVFTPGSTNVPRAEPLTIIPGGYPDQNYFYVIPSVSQCPWIDGWHNEDNEKISLVDNTVPVLAGTEARIFFQESLSLPGIMGLPIVPGNEYYFSLTEVSARTDATIALKIYDVTGTLLIQTIEPVLIPGTETLAYHITAPSNGKFLAIQIIGGSTNTAFKDPVFMKRTAETQTPQVAQPNHIQVYFRSDSDVKSVVRPRLTLVSSNCIPVATKSIVLTTSSNQTIGILEASSQFFPGDNQFPNTPEVVGLQSVSDVQAVVAIRLEAVTDMARSIQKEIEFRTNSLQVASKSLTLTSENLQTFTAIRVGDNVIVGENTIVGSDTLSLSLVSDNTERVQTGLTLTSDITKALVVKRTTLTSDVRAVVHKELVSTTENRQIVADIIHPEEDLFPEDDEFPGESAGIPLVSLSDTLGKVHVTLGLVSDNCQRVRRLLLLASSNSTHVHREIELATASRQVVNEVLEPGDDQFPSDTLMVGGLGHTAHLVSQSDTSQTVHKSLQLMTDNLKTVHIELKIFSSPGATNINTVVTSSPTTSSVVSGGVLISA